MKTKFSIDGRRIRINGSLTYSEYPNCPEAYRGLLMNARFIQGIFDDKQDLSRFHRFGKQFNAEKNTEELIAALPQWYEKGLRAFTVGFQGGGPCFTINNQTIDNNPYSPDGSLIDPAYLKRMKKIITAADEIGMLVIVSFFYGAQTRFLKDDLAVMQAVKTASNWLRDEKFTNVIIEIANEHNVEEYKIHPILFDGKGIAQLIQIAQRESGGIPVGCSTTGHYFSDDIGHASDIILIHGNNMSRQQFYNHIQEAKAIQPPKPIVCNEDSQALAEMQVALDQGVSWGYYNNMTKQEPPVYWEILEGEDAFFAARLADSLGIEKNPFPLEEQFYLQGLERNMVYEEKRWIRLASMYPEKIQKVEFYRNGTYFETAYNDPFTIHYIVNWYQKPTEGIQPGEVWKAVITLTDGTILKKETTVKQGEKNEKIICDVYGQ